MSALGVLAKGVRRTGRIVTTRNLIGRMSNLRRGMLVLVLILTTLLLVPSALAIEVDSGDGPEPPKNTQPKPDDPPCTSNCGGGGDNGTPEPEPPAVTYEWHKFTAVIDFRTTSNDGWVASQAYAACGPETKTRIGARVRYERLFHIPTDSYVASSDGFRDPSTRCINLGVTDTNSSCVVSSTAWGDKTVPVPRTRVGERTTLSSVGRLLARGDKPTVKQCSRAASEVSLRIDPSEHGFGRYRLEASTSRVPVVIRTTTDPINDETETVLHSIGTPSTYYVSDRSQLMVEYTCEGSKIVTTWTQPTPKWTADECETADPDPREWTCRLIDDSKPVVTINGQARSHAGLFRDGEANSVEFSRLRPRGNFTIDSARNQTRFLRGGTPWRDNGNSARQALFRFNTSASNTASLFTNDTGTAWRSGALDAGYVRGYWSSSESDPATLQAWWRYHGTMRVDTQVITGWEDGEWQWETRSADVPTTASCYSQVASFNFVRSTSTG